MEIVLVIIFLLIIEEYKKQITISSKLHVNSIPQQARRAGGLVYLQEVLAACH